MPETPLLFVLLDHTLQDSHHWDLCLDQGRMMTTWQFMRNPVDLLSPGATGSMLARRIQDHRRDYLVFEGPISGGRGHVCRIDRGPYTLLDRQPRRWRVRLEGSVLIGTFDLAAGDDLDTWTLHRVLPD